MDTLALAFALVALSLALFALRSAVGAKARIERAEAATRRAESTAEEAGERTGRLEQLVARLAAGEEVSKEMVEDGRLFDEITADDARRAIEEDRPADLFVLDVRTRGEVEGGHVPGATWIPIDELQERHGEVPTDRHVMIFCAMGSRSAAACDFLSSRGYARLTNVVGGMMSYDGETARGIPGGS